ncbi:TM2 domain-containing protein [Aquimarina sp. 2201CG5-10]|uniref:TM2 domain-containing protein n=1 Tax=Aquimarina callyspongiae TaxID=3098150 RepID=UPI002AB3A409|nr:TM2 domain-containing protein [Aquimarina sp. 2201CG5-10]MDY8136956.1 TM2 domain-containing protein [Aquimarina sp. 2201CG5-10]
MSEENNNLGDDIKKGAEEAADTVKETAKEFAEEAKETFSNATGENKKIMAGILAIVLGAFGVHKFILGYNKEGFILLGIFLVGFILSCFLIGYLFVWIPGVIGLVEGIIYLTKSDDEFYQTYQVNKKPWF